MKKFFHTVLTLFLLLIIFLLLFVGYISLRYMNWEKEFEKGKSGLRFAQAEYKNDELIASNNTMCLSLGNKCSTVLELRSLKMKSSYHSAQKGSLVNQKMNEIVKLQDLKLSETKGWK